MYKITGFSEICCLMVSMTSIKTNNLYFESGLELSFTGGLAQESRITQRFTQVFYSTALLHLIQIHRQHSLRPHMTSATCFGQLNAANTPFNPSLQSGHNTLISRQMGL